MPACPLVVVLEGVEKPGNVGAVLRSADGAGVSALVVADPRTDLFNPNAIRASLGTVFSLPVAESAARDVLAWLGGRGLRIVAARVEGAVAYTEVDYRRPTAIILGSEAAGLTALWSGEDVRPIRLPMLGVADSLNVSAAAAVLFYEALAAEDGVVMLSQAAQISCVRRVRGKKADGHGREAGATVKVAILVGDGQGRFGRPGGDHHHFAIGVSHFVIIHGMFLHDVAVFHHYSSDAGRFDYGEERFTEVLTSACGDPIRTTGAERKGGKASQRQPFTGGKKGILHAAKNDTNPKRKRGP